MSKPEKYVFVCTHSRPRDAAMGSCEPRGGQAIADAFASAFETRELWGRFKLSTSSCLGTCEQGPSVLVYPEGVMYQKVRAEDVAAIVDEHLLGGRPVRALLAPAEVWG